MGLCFSQLRHGENYFQLLTSVSLDYDWSGPEKNR